MSIKKIIVGDILNPHVITIKENAKINDVALLIANRQVSDVMVIDDNENFIGVLSEGDLLRGLIPNLDEIIAHKKTLSEVYEIFLDFSVDVKDQSIERFIIRNTIKLYPEEELLKAAVVRIRKNIRRVPVVLNKKLIEILSRADICAINQEIIAVEGIL